MQGAAFPCPSHCWLQTLVGPCCTKSCWSKLVHRLAKVNEERKQNIIVIHSYIIIISLHFPLLVMIVSGWQDRGYLWADQIAISCLASSNGISIQWAHTMPHLMSFMRPTFGFISLHAQSQMTASLLVRILSFQYSIHYLTIHGKT